MTGDKINFKHNFKLYQLIFTNVIWLGEVGYTWKQFAPCSVRYRYNLSAVTCLTCDISTFLHSLLQVFPNLRLFLFSGVQQVLLAWCLPDHPKKRWGLVSCFFSKVLNLSSVAAMLWWASISSHFVSRAPWSQRTTSVSRPIRAGRFAAHVEVSFYNWIE